MATKKKQTTQSHDVDAVMTLLRGLAKKSVRDGMTRFAIPAENALGVAVGDMRKLAKSLGRDHALAADLWKTGCYEARMLATMVDDPAKVTAPQMDRWAKDFDSWAICDTACFNLFDRTPFAWDKVRQWAKSPHEFVKRAAFALLASLAGHNKTATDDVFLDLLPLVEEHATDGRNFVKKGINWALRHVGERSVALNQAAVAMAQRLAESENAAARWVGKDAQRQLVSPAVRARLAKRSR